MRLFRLLIVNIKQKLNKIKSHFYNGICCAPGVKSLSCYRIFCNVKTFKKCKYTECNNNLPF